MAVAVVVVVEVGEVAAKQFGTNSAWQHLRPLQWAGITFQKAPLSPPGAAAMGWTLFVFPPHAAGFRGGEGQRWEGGRDVFEIEASPPLSIFTLWLFHSVPISPTWGFGRRLRRIAVRLVIFYLRIFFSFESPYSKPVTIVFFQSFRSDVSSRNIPSTEGR